jgi:type IV pilus assembly protein PilC
VAVGGLVIGVKTYANTEEGRIRMDQLKFKIPVVKNVTSNLITARFARTISTMLYSGVPLLDAMDNVAKVVGNAVAARDIQAARTEVRMGNSLAVPISQIDYMPKMLASMIKIGEESGALDAILDKTASFYEDEVETSLQQLVALFEPILILFMGLILGFIIISMMMPMFDMVNTIS